MLVIPFKALRIGGETLNENPVKYNKSRISEVVEQLIIYILEEHLCQVQKKNSLQHQALNRN